MKTKGELTIFLSYVPGIQAIKAMLKEAVQLQNASYEVLVGDLDRRIMEIDAQSHDFYHIPLIKFDRQLSFNLEEAIRRHPDIVLLDQPWVKNDGSNPCATRILEIERLLEEGIDVFTSLDVAEIESCQDRVYAITLSRLAHHLPLAFVKSAAVVNLVECNEDVGPAQTSQYLSRWQIRELRDLALEVSTVRPQPVPELETRHYLVIFSLNDDGEGLLRYSENLCYGRPATWEAILICKADIEYSQQALLINHLTSLAADLSGRLQVLYTDHVLTSLMDSIYANQVSDVILSQSNQGSAQLRYSDVSRQLRVYFPRLNIHLIRNEGSARPLRFWKRHVDFKLSLRDSLVAVFIMVISTLVTFLFLQWGLGEANIVMVYVIGILFVARLTQGILYALFSSILAMAVFIFNFASNQPTIIASLSRYPVIFFALLILALVTSTLTKSVRKQSRSLLETTRHSYDLNRLNQTLQGLSGLDQLVDAAGQRLRDIFQSSILIQGDLSKPPVLFRFEGQSDFFRSEQSILAQVIERREALDHSNCSAAIHGYYTPLIADQNVVGVVGIDHRHIHREEDRIFLNLLCSQIAMALGRQHFEDQSRRHELEIEREKQRSAFLRVISHDLRTPLTSIIGSSEVLMDTAKHQDPQAAQLLNHIHEDGQWMMAMVENLLTITRFNDQSQMVQRRPELLEEIVSSAIMRIENRFKQRKIEVQVPSQMVFIDMDGVLIQQVITNLIENAIKHSPADSIVRLTVSEDRDSWIFNVDDCGEGIDEDKMQHLFHMLEINSTDASRGLGIGLSLCLTIVRAHGGEMWAENKEKGARVSFSLPKRGKEA